MTVEELINELKRMPQNKQVGIGTLTVYGGIAKRVIEYQEVIEIESDEK